MGYKKRYNPREKEKKREERKGGRKGGRKRKKRNGLITEKVKSFVIQCRRKYRK